MVSSECTKLLVLIVLKNLGPVCVKDSDQSVNKSEESVVSIDYSDSLIINILTRVTISHQKNI